MGGSVRRDTVCIGLVLLALSGGFAAASREQVRVREIAGLDDPQALAELCRDPGWAIRRAAVARVPAGAAAFWTSSPFPQPPITQERANRTIQAGTIVSGSCTIASRCPVFGVRCSAFREEQELSARGRYPKQEEGPQITQIKRIKKIREASRDMTDCHGQP